MDSLLQARFLIAIFSTGKIMSIVFWIINDLFTEVQIRVLTKTSISDTEEEVPVTVNFGGSKSLRFWNFLTSTLKNKTSSFNNHQSIDDGPILSNQLDLVRGRTQKYPTYLLFSALVLLVIRLLASFKEFPILFPEALLSVSLFPEAALKISFRSGL